MLIKTKYLLFSILISTSVFAQSKSGNTISGFIKSAASGEAVIGANVLIYSDSLMQNQIRGTASNRYGFYTFNNVSQGIYYVFFSSLGYKSKVEKIEISLASGKLILNLELAEEELKLEEIIVKTRRTQSQSVSTIEFSPVQLKTLPSMSGELEIFKSLQMLPGIQVESEISNGLYIRGGSPDQTLVLVDGMELINPAHLGNFTSTFNSNALQDITLIKGAFPAKYGGRLSSVLDIKLRSGTKERDKGSISLGGVNSNLTLEGPLSEKSTYIFSARGMYFDLIQNNFTPDNLAPRYNYYDINTKFTFELSEDDFLSVSGIYNRDKFYSPSGEKSVNYDMSWKNSGVNFNWIHSGQSSFFTNTNVSYSSYEFNTLFEGNRDVVNAQNYYASSILSNLSLRSQIEYKPSDNNLITAGGELTFHNYSLLASDYFTYILDYNDEYKNEIFSAEAGLFVQTKYSPSKLLTANAGLRLSYHNLLKRFFAEPRISLALNFWENFRFKTAYALTNQFIHLIVRNDISLPSDLWYPVSRNIQPGTSQQIVGGLEYTTDNYEYLFSAEAYYRDMKNLYEFKDDTDFDPLGDMEQYFTSGEGESYGAEFFINKRFGDITGWIGYTYSVTQRKFEELNNGKLFYPKYDRRHDFALVLGYELFENLSFGLTWKYATGKGLTIPPAQFIFGNVEPIDKDRAYVLAGKRNGYRLPDYHKLDFNVKYTLNFSSKQLIFFFNIYNIYNRKNPFLNYVTYSEENPDRLIMRQISLFPVFPTVGLTYNF